MKETRECLHGEHALEARSNQFIVTGADKYIRYTQSGEEPRFNLTADPEECHNLIRAEHCQERIAYLRSMLIHELTGREEGYTDGKHLIAGQEPVITLRHIRPAACPSN